ncbi:hypothetical protein IWX92DRAFT_432380 [Phyllosticta citricarpa]
MSPSTTTKTLYSNTTKSLAASTTTASIFLSNLIKSIDSQTSLSPDTSTTSPDENITTRTMSLSITTETLYLNKTQTMTSIPTLTSTTRVLRTFTTTNLTTATAVLPSPAASTPAPSTTVTSNSQIPPSSPSPFCTGQCTVAAATINLIVWPDQTAETRQVISGTPITSVKAGITLTYPSVYFSLQSMSAYEICGSGTRTVGPETALPTFFPFDPKDISTITWTSWSSTFTKTEDGTTYEWWTASWSTITKSFDFTQLASCRQGTYGYSFPAISVTSAASGSYFTGASTGISSVFWPPCSPIFAIPTKITNFVPAWSTCTPNAPNGWFDPTISWTPLDGEITGPDYYDYVDIFEVPQDNTSSVCISFRIDTVNCISHLIKSDSVRFSSVGDLEFRHLDERDCVDNAQADTNLWYFFKQLEQFSACPSISYFGYLNYKPSQYLDTIHFLLI